MEYRRITPVDVLHLRGNRLFAEGGGARPVMPPWPSLFSGALRSQILTRHDALSAFLTGTLGGEVGAVVGSRREDGAIPGSLRLGPILLLRERNGAGAELLFPVPADLAVQRATSSTEQGGAARREVRYLQPTNVRGFGVSGSFEGEQLPVLRAGEPAKPEAGLWLTEDGFSAYLAGDVPSASTLVSSHELWADDPRLGIAMDPGARTAEAGMLYTSTAVALRPGVSFVVCLAGAGDGVVPADGLLRLGGDGHGAAVEPWNPTTDRQTRSLRHVPRAVERFKLVTASPCLFPGGWHPCENRDDRRVLVRRSPSGEEIARSRLVCAAVPRHEVVSGWDLAEGRPKPAERVVPTGAVYWFEVEQGSVEDFAIIPDEGLWPLLRTATDGSNPGGPDASSTAWRRAEGFNNAWLAEWKN
ncbi:MAG TPA: type III-B CRISPR module-associated Cmr3 family protein [Polyangiaceae bacterium]|nr:type III-B CRISPR module-associated Cmr3 family protein [Polyangiaceae bacterium]